MDSSPNEQPLIPAQPIDRFLDPIRHFLHIESMGGIALIVATTIALALANSRVSDGFLAFWNTPIGVQVGTFEFRQSIHHLIDDGLMVIFFFMVGLEVKRELVLGELRGFKRAALPLIAAIGGMVVPAGMYLLLQAGKPGARGWGIAMATDIAFVVGCMALLGPRIPRGLRVLLLSLAIADDVGAILVIAIGYADSLHLIWLAIGLMGFVVVFGLGRLGVRRFSVYIVCSVLIWFAFHQSGIHTTIAGVILGLLTPVRSTIIDGGVVRILKRFKAIIQKLDWRTETHRVEKIRKHRRFTRELVSPVEYLINVLHPWVSFVIMPLFALANAGVKIRIGGPDSSIAFAVAFGLCVGKPLGIVLAALCAVKSGISRLPEGVTWLQVVGGGILAGIGFTMALFIASLALEGNILDKAKVGVIISSLISAGVGMIVLWLASRSNGNLIKLNTAEATSAGQTAPSVTTKSQC